MLTATLAGSIVGFKDSQSAAASLVTSTVATALVPLVPFVPLVPLVPLVPFVPLLPPPQAARAATITPARASLAQWCEGRLLLIRSKYFTVASSGFRVKEIDFTLGRV